MPATMDRAVKLAFTVECAGRDKLLPVDTKLNGTQVQLDWALCSGVPPET
jgi:hypothetical protein